MPSDHWVPDLVHKLTQNSTPELAEKARIHAVKTEYRRSVERKKPLGCAKFEQAFEQVAEVSPLSALVQHGMH